jgi:Cytotoxic translational repressor of toxin-antitoxin stability system
MTYNIIYTDEFAKRAKECIKENKKNNKNPTLSDKLEELLDELEKGNFVGTPIQGVGLPPGEMAFKFRIDDSDKNIGKSGGYRVVYYNVRDNEDVYLVTMYSKKKLSDIEKGKLRKMIIKQCI